jgi:hypothetical protein
MAEVTMVENNPRTGRAFWGGFGLGVAFMIVAVVVFWFLGVIDLLPQEETVDESNNVTVEVNTSTTNATNATNLNEIEEEVANLTAEEEAEDEKNASFVDNEFYISAVTAKDVDDQANPVNETADFTTDDDRVYVFVSLEDSIPAGTEVGIEWFKDGKSLSDFSTDVEKGQSVAYFYQPISGEGEYSAKILIGGDPVDEIEFSVSKP